VKVLIVEPGSVARQLAYRLLTQSGAQVSAFEELTPAQSVRSDENFDAWLLSLDAELEPILSLVRRRREFEKARQVSSVRIIGLTNEPEGRIAASARVAGFDLVLKKPVRRQELLEAISGSRAAEGGASGVTPTDSTGSAVLPPVSFDVHHLNESSAGDPARARRLLGLFLEELAPCLEKLDAAVRNSDTAEANRVAHRLAGSASACGFVNLAGLLRSLERTHPEMFAMNAPGLLQEITRAGLVARNDVEQHLRANH
jgi:HPt (histidine-containing phosphotransfer) domain-containing protein